MLSAEHYALENELVRSVLEIKQKEIEFYLDRFSAIATQSALLLGVVTGGFASFDSGKFNHPDHPWLKSIEIPYIYCGTLSYMLPGYNHGRHVCRYLGSVACATGTRWQCNKSLLCS